MKHWIKLASKNKMYNHLQSNLHKIGKMKKRQVTILNETFIQYPDVFPIDKFGDTEIFTKAITVKPEEEFLEIGIGTGVTAIMVAKAGANVTGVDINPAAVKNANENALQQEIGNNVNFFVSDVFDKVPNKLFDTIYFNVPFCFSEISELTELQKSVFDYQYSTLEKFINNSMSFLKPNGRLLIGFSNFWGLPDKLFGFFYGAGFQEIKILLQQNVEWNTIRYDLTLYEIKNIINK
jgi:release factor glutamine methyltransferase